MATATTTQWSNSYTPQAKLTVTQSSETDTTVTLAYTLQYVAYGYAASTNGVGRAYSIVIDGTTVKSGTYNINGVSSTTTITSGTTTVSKTQAARSVAFSVSFTFDLTWSGVYGGTKSASSSISISAITSYTVSYNANGGSGAPTSQTKWYGTNITLSTTTPTRTGYTFKGWATSSTSTTVSYAAGATYSSNASITLYAVWTAITYTVSYNANGGSGAPSSQTKTYGVTLTLSSTKPTRTYYTFKGWATSSGGSVAYSAGGSYTTNASVTLYAVWELAYTKPVISSLSVTRCNSSGTADEEGAYCKLAFSWSTTYSVSSITYSVSTTSATISASGTSGSVSQVIGGSLSTETTYTVKVTVTDSGGSTSKSIDLPSMTFLIDFKGASSGVAIGKVAEVADCLDIGLDTRIRGSLRLGGTTGEGSIEMYGTNSTPSPYIDFHYSGSTDDYTSRIIENSSGVLTISKALSIGTTLTVTGATTLNSTLAVTGAATLSSTLKVTGTTTLYNLVTTGVETFATTPGISGYGYTVYGRTTDNAFSVAWTGSSLQFYVDSTNVYSTSDERLKKDFGELDEGMIDAVGETPLLTYHINRANYDDTIEYAGVTAQALIKKMESKGLSSEASMQILTRNQDTVDNETLYWGVDYEQFLIYRTAYNEKRIAELENKIAELEDKLAS